MHSRFQAALTTLAADLQAAIAPMLADPHFPGAARSRSGGDAAACDRSGRRRAGFCATAACRCLRAPDLSHFNVGAIARGVSGRWYFGGNMEFLGATMQQTVHAEQSAISHAWLRGETSLRAITVNYTPCGHCRQFMNELNSGLALRIHLPGREAHALEHYLPDAFGPKDLEIKTLLMDEQDHGYPVSGDVLTQAAYSGRQPLPIAPLQPLALPGVALELKDGTIFSGSYAENAAFNPTLRRCRGR